GAKIGANLRMKPLGDALGALNAQPVDEQLLRELALTLEASHQLGDLLAGRDGLKSYDIDIARTHRAVEVRQADPIVARLARKDEPLQLGLARRIRIPHDQLVAVGVAREVAEQRSWVEVGLLLPHPLEPWLEVVAQQPRPVLALDPSPAPVKLEQ